jgi:hypothetical protein
VRQFHDFPLYGSFDVVVVGGGTAGFAAGVSAARAGSRTLVIEEQAFLGGHATGAHVGVLFGFEKGETNESLHGLVGEMMRRLMAVKGSSGIETVYCLGLRDMDVPAATYNNESLRVIMDQMAAEAKAKVLFHTRCIGLDMERNSIKTLYIHNTKGIQRVEAKVIIDASFHASVANEAGVPCVAGDAEGVLQPGTLMFKMADVDWDTYSRLSQEDRKVLALKGLSEGDLPVNFLLARRLQNGVVFQNMSRISVNVLDPDDWSRAEAEARVQVVRISDWWIENVPGFAKAYLVATGTAMGIRDSRRIVGKHILTKDDIMSGHEFEDSIASSSYPIDIHHKDGHRDNTLIRPASGLFYIPYRCLIAKEVDNLLVVGRSISTDHEAHGAVRVMITCMRTGEAAGLAAHESIESHVPVNMLDGAKVKKIINKLS